jgi:hypothetical protein
VTVKTLLCSFHGLVDAVMLLVLRVRILCCEVECFFLYKRKVVLLLVGMKVVLVLCLHLLIAVGVSLLLQHWRWRLVLKAISRHLLVVFLLELFVGTSCRRVVQRILLELLAMLSYNRLRLVIVVLAVI